MFRMKWKVLGTCSSRVSYVVKWKVLGTCSDPGSYVVKSENKYFYMFRLIVYMYKAGIRSNW